MKIFKKMIILSGELGKGTIILNSVSKKAQVKLNMLEEKPFKILLESKKVTTISDLEEKAHIDKTLNLENDIDIEKVNIIIYYIDNNDIKVAAYGSNSGDKNIFINLLNIIKTKENIKNNTQTNNINKVERKIENNTIKDYKNEKVKSSENINKETLKYEIESKNDPKIIEQHAINDLNFHLSKFSNEIKCFNSEKIGNIKEDHNDIDNETKKLNQQNKLQKEREDYLKTQKFIKNEVENIIKLTFNDFKNELMDFVNYEILEKINEFKNLEEKELVELIKYEITNSINSFKNFEHNELLKIIDQKIKELKELEHRVESKEIKERIKDSIIDVVNKNNYNDYAVANYDYYKFEEQTNDLNKKALENNQKNNVFFKYKINNENNQKNSNNTYEPRSQIFNSSAIKQSSEKIKPLTFYEQMKDQIEKLFNTYPMENKLNKLLPNSRFIKVDYDGDGKYYVVGLIGKKPDYICYGVPAFFSEKPPKALDDDGSCQWMPIDPKNPQGEGYWLMYQDAINGNSIKHKIY